MKQKPKTESVRGWMTKEQLEALANRMVVAQSLCRINGLDFDTMTPEELDALIERHTIFVEEEHED